MNEVVICGDSGLDRCLFFLAAALTAAAENLMMEFKHLKLCMTPQPRDREMF